MSYLGNFYEMFILYLLIYFYYFYSYNLPNVRLALCFRKLSLEISILFDELKLKLKVYK